MREVIEMTDKKRSPEEYLKEPYSRVIVPDKESGTYTAQILEFPGCIAEGDTIQEAHERLEETALSWIEAAVDLGQEVPPPASVSEYGGKIALRLPKSLHRQVALAAERDGTSINQFIVMAVSERVGAGKLYSQLAKSLEDSFFQICFQGAIQNFMVPRWNIVKVASTLAASPEISTWEWRKYQDARNGASNFFSQRSGSSTDSLQ